MQTNEGNKADITFGSSPNTGGNFAQFVRQIPPSTGYIEAGRVKLNADVLLKKPETLQLKIILHEIGNILGLGDIKCAPRLLSVQEDNCKVKEPFTGGNKLYDYDIQLIKHVYGETTSGAKSSSPLSAPPQTSPAPFPKKENRFIGTKRKDKIIATNGMDLIIGNGGADVINARGGDDLIDPSRWTGGGYDVVRGMTHLLSKMIIG